MMPQIRWTWRAFLWWAFGPRELEHLAHWSGEARRWATRAVLAHEHDAVRYELACSLREIRACADRHFWYDEAEIAHMLELDIAHAPLSDASRRRVLVALDHLDRLIRARYSTLEVQAA